MKSRYLHYPPHPDSYLASKIWTPDGHAAKGLFEILFLLKVVKVEHFL